MKDRIIYVHGKGGSVEEAEHYRGLFPEAEVVGFDYHAQTPWEAREEFPQFFAEQRKHCDHLVLIANSIGAFFSMSSLNDTLIDQAHFISPVVDMEKLIGNMIIWANVTEQELAEKSEIPTRILYGEHDNLTDLETISVFAKRVGAELTIMQGGEHWFHTEQQMRFLDDWILRNFQKA